MRLIVSSLSALTVLFQFTHPGRGATRRAFVLSVPASVVSIHAPREGCDEEMLSVADMTTSFNSRTPGGVRQNVTANTSLTKLFQFTHPGRGATVLSSEVSNGDKVSIHAPREGCDLVRVLSVPASVVSIHAPREGCDSVVQSCVLWGG